jgi:hypothetical protein
MVIELNDKQKAALMPSIQQMKVHEEQYLIAKQKLSEVVSGIISSYDYKEGSSIDLNLEKGLITITPPELKPNRAIRRKKK